MTRSRFNFSENPSIGPEQITLKLSPKAQLFTRQAVTEARSRPLGQAAQRLGADPWSHELSREAEQIVSAALDGLTAKIREQLQTELAEEEEADLSNDLGFIEAVRSDLRHSRRRAARTQ
jgi:hypothetical protein